VKRTLIGMLTPSSNTVLEPITSLMLADVFPTITAHFGRFRVTSISLEASSQGQFDQAPVVAAAELLADAKVDVIVWNGTSASWLGFERDEALCRSITERTGRPATSAILGLNDLVKRKGVIRLGLVTPYAGDVQERIVANYRGAGVEVVAERHLGLTDNFSFAETTEEEVAGLCRDVARGRPEAIAIVCTNMRGAFAAPALEAELGIPVFDSVAFTLWKALTVIGADPTPLRRWGSLFH
jgi:maleate isomerase